MESVRRDIVPLVQDLIFNCLAVSIWHLLSP
jgi:hypothetical protein